LVQASGAGEEAFTAFDVLNHWIEAPRYGYLYDFKPGRSQQEIDQTMDYLLAMHINGLQFYDWQYRHDTLLPPQDAFTDPLGRSLSLETVRTLIEAAHIRGMAAMPYTAIYAASPVFAGDHPDWQLFDATGKVVDFANGFLKITNPHGPWQTHFVEECSKVLKALPFDGIHVDQYGEPKTGFDADGLPVDLPLGFVEILDNLRQRIDKDKAVVFNLVNNWPVEPMTESQLSFWYSELWPPETDLQRLWRTIVDNQHLNPRPVVLALYIPPQWEHTVMMVQATILAAGGTHIAHGDHCSYLSDPYFPKAQQPSPTLAERLQQLADFAVAYEEGLAFGEDVTEDWIRELGLGGVNPLSGRVIIRSSRSRLFINILNGDGRWDAELSAPVPLEGLHLTFSSISLRHKWYASPEEPVPQELSDVRLPAIKNWLLICLEFEDIPR
jgi:dextranase